MQKTGLQFFLEKVLYGTGIFPSNIFQFVSVKYPRSIGGAGADEH